MLSAIFQPEVSVLEFQVAALQAQIDAHTDRISLLSTQRRSCPRTVDKGL